MQDLYNGGMWILKGHYKGSQRRGEAERVHALDA